MRSTSENSLNRAIGELRASVSGECVGDVTTASPAETMTVAENFYGLSDAARELPQLSQALSDPGRSREDKYAFVDDVLAHGVEPVTRRVVAVMAKHAWSDPRDIADAFECLGNEAVFLAAEQDGKLADVQTQLFAVMNLLHDNRDLRVGVSDLGVGTAHQRAHFIAELLGDRVNDYTRRLVRRAVRLSVHGRLLASLRSLADMLATRRDQVVASVHTASPLTEEQRRRLAGILTRRTGRAVALNEVVDPSLIGGIHVSVDGQALNASVRASLDQARQKLVGTRSQ